jgi:rubrerythrin
MVATYPQHGQSKLAPVAQLPQQERVAPTVGLRKPVGSVSALYAHAMLIEHEAVERYREFASNMAEHGNDTVAELFGKLAEFEAEHAFHLAKKTAGMALPKLAATEYAWLDKDAPLPEAHAFVYRMLTPRIALEIALHAEERAKAFFERVLAESRDKGIREVALEMARDEQAHIAWVNEALTHVPPPFRPSEELPGDPTIPQQL